jgi:DNA-directed RNA polymerase subunit RPC12/RpoP
VDLIDLLRQEITGDACLKCARDLGDAAITVLAQNKKRALVQLRCAGCGGRRLVRVEVSPAPEGRRADGQKRVLLDALTQDTVLDAHRALRNFEGPLTALFS